MLIIWKSDDMPESGAKTKVLMKMNSFHFTEYS